MVATINQALVEATEQLVGVCELPALDAHLLLSYVTGKTKTQLITWPDNKVKQDELTRYRALVKKRSSGVPLAYIIGTQAFWNFSVSVNENTLIPRQDTELLIESVLDIYNEHSPASVLDLGTGSGIIAIALAKEFPDSRVTAIEKHQATLDMAKHNFASNHCMHIVAMLGEWYAPVKNNRFDLICSNPPYVADSDPHLNDGSLHYEPKAALAAGRTGLDDLTHIISQAPLHLNSTGVLVVEHGYDQKTAVQTLFQNAGFSRINTRKDYGGNDRITLGHLNHSNPK